MDFDEYLDTNAARVLGTTKLTLVSRVPAFAETTAQIGQLMQQRRQRLEGMSNGSLIQYVVHGQYGATGGKLYRAEIDGKPKYLLLEVSMLADEYGSYSPMNQQLVQRNQQLLRGAQSMMGGGVLGGLGALGGLFSSPASIPSPPNKPSRASSTPAPEYRSAATAPTGS